MKIMSRDFTPMERVLLLFLAVVLVGLAYYWFVDQPVRTTIRNAEAEMASLQTELDIVQVQLEEVSAKRAELDNIESSGKVSYMGSYNNSEEELAFLNDVLSDTLQYSISFSNVTRSGDQIRRNFSLSFRTASYKETKQILDRLSNGDLRCLVSNISCSYASGLDSAVTVNASATFFETMVGGTADAGLPQDAADTNT